MKAVVGVGYMKHCLAGIEIFVRLRFPKPEVVLVHSVESVLPDGGFVPVDATTPIAQIQNQRKVDGEKRMAEVSDELKAKGVKAKSVTTYGKPAHEITGVAQQEEADIVIAGSNRKGRLEAFLMGSVSRALVSDAKRSILVGKQTVSDGEKVNAVFATDHSDYADQCVDLLVTMGPKGLGKVTVVLADTTEPEVWDALREEYSDELDRDAILQRKNDDVCRRLRPICDEVESVVLQGEAIDVINAAMEKTEADLLILGAHGHGFLERLMMGSTAMHMVGNAPWNVLVLRV